MPISPLAVEPFLLTVNGIPAHPLVVHAVVVFAPLAGLGALAYLVPRWRDRVRWPMLITVVLAFVFIWAAYLTGTNFRNAESYFQTGPLGEQIDKHEDYATVLRWIATGFTVVAVVAAGWLHARKDGLRVAVSGLLGILAVATLVYVLLTGEAGAKAVYPPASFKSVPAVVSTR